MTILAILFAALSITNVAAQTSSWSSLKASRCSQQCIGQIEASAAGDTCYGVSQGKPVKACLAAFRDATKRTCSKVCTDGNIELLNNDFRTYCDYARHELPRPTVHTACVTGYTSAFNRIAAFFEKTPQILNSGLLEAKKLAQDIDEKAVEEKPSSENEPSSSQMVEERSVGDAVSPQVPEDNKPSKDAVPPQAELPASKMPKQEKKVYSAKPASAAELPVKTAEEGNDETKIPSKTSSKRSKRAKFIKEKIVKETKPETKMAEVPKMPDKEAMEDEQVEIQLAPEVETESAPFQNKQAPIDEVKTVTAESEGIETLSATIVIAEVVEEVPTNAVAGDQAEEVLMAESQDGVQSE